MAFANIRNSPAVLLVPLDRLLTNPLAPLRPTLIPALRFAISHPALLSDATILSVSATVGQALIYFCIKDYGALALSTIMTTRQFLSIFFSALIFMHSINGTQWFSFFLVFGALYFRAYAAIDRAAGRAEGEEVKLLSAEEGKVGEQ